MVCFLVAASPYENWIETDSLEFAECIYSSKSQNKIFLCCWWK